MKKELIFIDNEREVEAIENKHIAQRRLAFHGGLSIDALNTMQSIYNFHAVQNKVEEQMFDINNAVVTYSMFTENHFGSYDQLCDFMVIAGLQELKGKILINTSTYLRDALERAIEHYNQSVYIIRCIETNYIIHYDSDIEQFKRLRFDMNVDGFLINEDIDLSTLLGLTKI
jgi:hypothetical protein